MAWLATLRRCLVQTQTRPAQGSLSSVGNPSSFLSSRSVHSSVHAMNRRSSHAVPLSENEYCQMAALDQALRFLLRPSLPQSCGWQPLRSDQLFEEILLCVILHADWLSRLEGHSCIIFMATKKIENNRGQSAFKGHTVLEKDWDAPEDICILESSQQ